MENRIQELRKRKKLSQEELAEKLEVTRQTIISLEKGRYNASLLLAHKIASFFNLRIEEVFLFEEDEAGNGLICLNGYWLFWWLLAYLICICKPILSLRKSCLLWECS